MFSLSAEDVKEIRQKITILTKNYDKFVDNKLSANWKLNWRKNNQTTWFLDCHQWLLSVSCGIMILSWTSTLHKKKAFCIVRYYILKQNYRNWPEMKIASDVYCRNKLVSHRKESVKWPYKLVFYAFMCLCVTENQSLWAFKSDRSIYLQFCY